MFRNTSALLGCLVLTLFGTLLAAQTWPTRLATNNGPGTCCLDTGLTGCCPGIENSCLNLAGQCKGIGFYSSVKPILKRPYGNCDARLTDLSCTSYDQFFCCISLVYEDAFCDTRIDCILYHYQPNGCDSAIVGQKCP